MFEVRCSRLKKAIPDVGAILAVVQFKKQGVEAIRQAKCRPALALPNPFENKLAKQYDCQKEYDND
jgi:hypothetical protein